MKHRFLIIAAALTAGLASFSACMKESEIDEKYRPAGTEIIFSAESTYKNNEDTRTEFTNTDVGVSGYTNKFERINWVAGDAMSISYQRSGSTTQTGTYAVNSTPTASGELSNAGVQYIDAGTKLTWLDGSGDHLFFAMYPDNSSTSNALSPVSGGATITGTVYGTQSVTYNPAQKKYLPSDMSKCYMVGYKKVSSTGSESRVTIPFTPAVTIFEFILKKQEGSAKVKSVELKADNLTGTFSFKLTGGTNSKGEDWWNRSTTSGSNRTSVSGAGNTITVTFPSPVTMTTTEAVNFTVLALPVDISNITVTLEMSTDGGSHYFKKHLDLNHTFKAAKKHIITNYYVPNETWTYTLEHTGEVKTLSGVGAYEEVIRTTKSAGDTDTAPLASFYTKQGDPAKYNVDVTYQYAPDNNGVPGTFSATKPTGLSSVSTSGSVNKNLYATVTANTSAPEVDQTGIDLVSVHAQKLRDNGYFGSNTAPQDLSLLEITETGLKARSSGKPTTANCYIVDRPGYYMFPLVYGNSIDHTRSSAPLYINGANLYSYKESANPGSPEMKVWHVLQNSNGTAITTPYILDDLGLTTGQVEAVYMWQDIPDGEALIIPAASISVTTKSTSNMFYDPVAGSYKTTVPYIRFEVPTNSIRQGNIVIALRRNSGNKEILWSWHIWVSDGYDANSDGRGEGFSTFNVATREGVMASNDFLPITLGWCDTGTATTYKDRVWWVKVIQNTSGNELLFRVVQRTEPTADATSSGTFYQWGRKDPFPPTDGDSPRNKACTVSESQYNPIQGTNKLILTYSNFETAAMSIQHPNYFYVSSNMADAIDGGFYNWLKNTLYPNNLWNMNQGSSTDDKVISKTVYDPCPPGFCMPNKYAFTLFTTTGTDSNKKAEFNVLDRNGDGVIDNGDFKNGANYGWYFYTNASKSVSVWIPAFGLRDRQTGDYKYTLTPQYGDKMGNYWTGAPSHYQNGTAATSLDETRDLIYPHAGESRSYGYPIRPVKE